MKKTKIVCTLGPATDQPEIQVALLQNGMNVARFNFSHGSHADHKQRMTAIREASKKTGIPVGIMLDTKGPEMRLGTFKHGKVTLEKGAKFILTGKAVEGDEHIVSINHKTLAQEIIVGNQILLSDGLIQLTVTAIDQLDIHTVVDNTGQISNGKRVAVPGANLSLPPLSEKDIEDITFGIQEDVDFIAASFIQRASDIVAIKDLLKKHQASIKIIAKIENAEGVKNLEHILDLADGLMIARGDLGVEIPAEEVPLIQKRMISLCNEKGKPVITATQMLESMVNNPRPTRAEASDVANAILDGTDAIMLSGETASGQYPIEAVKTMTTIALRMEDELSTAKKLAKFGFKQTNTTDAISHATVQVCLELNAKGIITATESGFTAQMVSRYRPQTPVFAVTPHQKTIRSLQLVWGVIPLQGDVKTDTDAMTTEAINRCLQNHYIEKGDLVVMTAGIPIGLSGSTNMIQVHVVGSEETH
ncbi:pyruvate kinase [Neisseria sp. Ec49-e6-T10]|uniref:pyruvate kinase n=1 Tax=Neisseria sp. Ec49-e6-T10 TaxID=3140744 RepID=UPI003EC01A41